MDERFNLKVEFYIYGRTFKWNPSFNWSADPGDCDRRIAEWFTNCHAQAQAEWAEKHDAERVRREATEVEQREREELKRLREKYPTL